MRGEYFRFGLPLKVKAGSPPLAWGIRKTDKEIKIAVRITPTCVGNTHEGLYRRERTRDHPHLRGEYLGCALQKAQLLGSPPLAWGIHVPSRSAKEFIRITPTCVGNTIVTKHMINPSRDHPHLRGEYQTMSSGRIYRSGSPPLAWGIPGQVDQLGERGRITPTCVGNTVNVVKNRFLGRDHPHLRGEYQFF